MRPHPNEERIKKRSGGSHALHFAGRAYFQAQSAWPRLAAPSLIGINCHLPNPFRRVQWFPSQYTPSTVRLVSQPSSSGRAEDSY